ncbi:hypothetical protein SOVF_190740 [Spinacia oleracea]|uniref:Uncharacterized protein n=1 Tax=Spinacia oleracea TaxID=3562 RepID=A0A9R0K6B8_SPIOL|nr:uncharacterized protein LOC110799196 [Spinacia oleracea]KNA05395.1 hypothetical protein SOVF_190740 [Spinacia oleracea]
MSLALIQSYSSAEEDEREESNHHYDNFSDDDNDSGTGSDNSAAVSRFPSTYNPVVAPKSSQDSALPSALDAFSEISGPPQFLNNCVEDQNVGRDIIVHRVRRNSRNKKDLPTGAVVEAKPHLVGIHERVRSDIEGSVPSTGSTQPQKTPPVMKTADGSQPSMCLLCGIPKTYTSALGMVCPVCPSDDSKKKGSTVKDKEKIKRMRGQSSHASWKSETEMHLRQTFD